MILGLGEASLGPRARKQESMVVQTRKRWADIGRGFAIITIIFFHAALALEPLGPIHWRVWLYIAMFSPVPIGLFFFISGMFSRTLMTGAWKGKIVSRIASLIYVFVVWSLIDVAVATLLHQDVPLTHLLWTYILDPDSVLWFIWGLAIFTVLANLVWIRWPRATLSLAVIASLLSCTHVIATSSYVYDNLIRFLPFFLMGLSGEKLERLVIPRRIAVFGLGSLLYAGLILVYLQLNKDGAPAGLVWIASAWIAVPLSVAGCSLVSNIPLASSIVEHLGKRSLAIYLAHQTVTRLVVAGGSVLIGVVEKPQLISVFTVTFIVTCATAAFAEVTLRSGWTLLYGPPVYWPFRRPPR